VHCLPSGQYLCDRTCLQWKSSSLCSHTVAVAGLNGDLELFVAWYVGTKQGTNLTALAVHGLPSGRGRKGGVPPRPRSKSNVSRDVTTTTVLRPAVAPLTNNQPSRSRSTQLFQPSASALNLCTPREVFKICCSCSTVFSLCVVHEQCFILS